EQSVALPPRDDVHVNVRHALADPRIHRDEGAVRAERGAERDRETAREQEQWRDLAFGHVLDGGVVPRGHDERVSRKDRSVVEERHDVLVAIHREMLRAADDSAEHAGFTHPRSPATGSRPYN